VFSPRSDCAACPAEGHVGNIELGRDAFTCRTLLKTPAFAAPRGGNGLQSKIRVNQSWFEEKALVDENERQDECLLT
jgi:hypothetical protein